MNYIHLEQQPDGRVKGEAEFNGEKYTGVFADMELAIIWVSELEESAHHPTSSGAH